MFTRLIRVRLALVLGLAALLVAAMSLAGARSTYGAPVADPGGLDFSFGSGGRVTSDFPIDGVTNILNEARALAIQPDGKIVVAGNVHVYGPDYNFGLARYNPDGSLDGTFGSSHGFASLNFEASNDDGAYAIAIQPDGKIVAVGSAQSDYYHSYYFGAARFNPNGSADTSFNSDSHLLLLQPGRMWYWFAYATGETSQANGVAIQGDGKIVMAGFTESENKHKVALMRINPDGSPDSTFNAFVRPGSGQVITDFFGGESVCEARAVAIQPDGKIVVAGTAQKSGTNYDFALARYNPNGSLDATFGTGGKVTTDFLGGGDDQAFAMDLQPDGKIVVAGKVHTASTGYDFGVARYLSNGTLDATFPGGGIESIPFGPGTAEEKANAVAVQADGKIVVAGYAQGYAKDFALVRLNPNGSLDTSFGVGGKLTTDFGGADDTAQGIAVQADGNIILAGTAYMGPTRREDFALARYQGSNGVPPGPPPRPIPSPYSPKPAPTSTPKANPTPTATPPTTASRYFSATAHTVKGPFLQYWEQHGGLAQQGYPITEEIQERSDTDGKVYTMQYFERAVFEMHPENPAPNNVLLSLLGVFYYNDKYSGNAPDQHASTNNPRYFPETGKTFGGVFRKYWETHGGLAQQGYPISDEFEEVSQTDGKTYTVQYFQRAVFEYHPEFVGTPNEVLLSLLGVFYDQKKHAP